MIEEAKNAWCIGYECIVCKKKLSEKERQQIIVIGYWQTWCLLCAFKNDIGNKHLENYLISNGENNIIEKIMKIKQHKI